MQDRDGEAQNVYIILIYPVNKILQQLGVVTKLLHIILLLPGFGNEVDPSVVALFNKMNLRSAHKYAAFKIDNMKVVIDYDMLGDPAKTITVGGDESQFNKMKSLLNNQEPRYILYDFRLLTKKGG